MGMKPKVTNYARLMTESEVVRFWKYVDKSAGPNLCWPWQKGCSLSGYGKFWIKGLHGYQKTNRVALSLALPDLELTECACHICDNKACCNPRHLWHGTQKDNIKDCILKGRFKGGQGRPRGWRYPKGIYPANTKLTPEQVIEIRKLYSTGNHFQRSIAEDYGVSRANIAQIVNRLSWKNI